MKTIRAHLRAAIHLFYPHTCIGCGSDLLSETEQLCIQCFDELPFTGFEQYEGNPVEKIFYGRTTIVSASCGFYFNKGGIVQHLIHELKYKGNKEAGICLGKLMGSRLSSSGRFDDIDYLVPLPLFADREYKRGYNQAELICTGMSETMHVPLLSKNVLRVHATETQTKKHRTERWENVSESFRSSDPVVLQNKHILLVDDVITTGATLEACAQAIAKNGNVRISIAALALAAG